MDHKISEFFGKLSFSSGALTGLGGILAYKEYLSIIFAGIGALVALASLLITWYYKHQEHTRARVIFELDIRERRLGIKKDTGQRRRRTDTANQTDEA